MRRHLAALWELVDIDARDAHVYGGLALVAGGLSTLWRPGGAIVFGLGLMYLALRRAPGPPNPPAR